MFEHYSSDEAAALIVAILIGVVFWAMWYYALAATGRGFRPRVRRWPLALAPLFCMVLVYGVLRRWSSEDVRTDNAYMLFYMVVGLAWLGVFQAHLPLFGLSVRDDVLERGNPVTGWTVIGALIGGTCCFAGGNVGNGPGWWVVLFSGLVSTASLFFLWWLLHAISGFAEKVTIERDAAAGLRAAGFFVGSGLILGRAVAGDWVSAGTTLTDFARMSWPALILAGAVATVERSAAPVPNQAGAAVFLSGLLPALMYVGTGAVVLLAF